MTLDWDGKEGDVPKYSYKVEPDRTRDESRATNQTTTDDNTGVSMSFSRHKFDSQDKFKEQNTEVIPFCDFQNVSHDSDCVPARSK